ncbi:uncharacterized protein LOC5521493 [Nematostella vectensis]|uniref:uncharacterized protein LOC5521493 n=1 Tax=Nematostella vectensis TaxID=45351 RepID=UPI0020777B74|nr:uncharacterized protein LOC5521493 [Nematostella vectensis]
MTTKVPVSTFVVLLLAVSVHGAKEFCSKIFFQNVDEDAIPYKVVMDGVYIKQPGNHNNFPVYFCNSTGLFFYYDVSSDGSKYLLFAKDFKSYFGVGAELKSHANPVNWMSTGSLNRKDIFGELVYKWKYWSMKDSINYYVNKNPTAVCVDEDFIECDSNSVYMTTTITDGSSGATLNDPKTDYFSRRIGDFKNLRPVYYQSTARWYLYYDGNGYWIMSTSRYNTAFSSSGTILRVKDLAMRPEFITNKWYIYYYGWIETKGNVSMRCRGIQHGSNGCAIGSPCGSNGKCIYTFGNETVCDCNPGYTGQRCTINKQCVVPSLNTGEIGGKYETERVPGSKMVLFCNKGISLSWRFGVCVDGSSSPYWSREGSACHLPYTAPPPTWSSWTNTRAPWSPWSAPTRPPGGSSRKRVDFDDYPALLPSVLTIAILLQILLPLLIWLGALCFKSCKETGEETEDESRLQEFTCNIETRLQEVARAETPEEQAQKVREYQDAVRRYQAETESRDKKRKRGLYRNASFFRLYSMGMWISFIMWCVFLIGCRASKCGQYGTIMVYLLVMAIVMVCVAPVIFLLESLCSHERSYITNIMKDETAWDYIKRMQQVAPVINMVVECYHYETRTRVVYYTDANGNQQSRTETYQEKVTTFIDTDTFDYGSWLDVSKNEMPELSSVELTRLKIDPVVEFGDVETAQSFDTQREEMIERNRHRDVYQDFSYSRDIPGLEKRISAYVNLTQRPFWIREMYYWLATFLCMTWPYRWLFRAKTAKNYYDLKKKIYKSSTPPPQVDIMNPLALLGMNPVIPNTYPSPLNPAFQSSTPDVNAVPSAPYPQASGVAPPYPLYTPADAAFPPAQAPYPPPYPTPAGGYPPDQGGYPLQTMGPPPDAPPPSYDSAVKEGTGPARC